MVSAPGTSNSKSKGHLLSLGLVFVFPHSCSQCPEPAPPTSGCYRNAPKLLATPTCPPRHQKGRAPGQWEGWGRLSLGNVPTSPTVSLAVNVVTIARWETVVGTTAPPPGLRPPHSVLTGLFSFPVPTRAWRHAELTLWFIRCSTGRWSPPSGWRNPFGPARWGQAFGCWTHHGTHQGPARHAKSTRSDTCLARPSLI